MLPPPRQQISKNSFDINFAWYALDPQKFDFLNQLQQLDNWTKNI